MSSPPTVILLAIDARAAKLHRNYGYSIICISLSITLTSASPLPLLSEGYKSLKYQRYNLAM